MRQPACGLPNRHGFPSVRRAREKILLLIAEQPPQQVQRFGGDKFSADLMTGKAAAFQQEDAPAIARGGDGGGASRRARADHNQIVRVGHAFHAIIPMR